MTGQGLELAHAAAMPTPQGGALPTTLEWDTLLRMAEKLAESDVIPYKLKRKPADIATILLAAREYGIPPLMALSKLPVVNGTPAPMGELMVALVLRAGHRIAATVMNADGTPYRTGGIGPEHYAECRTRRHGEAEDDVLTFTMAEAVAAGLVSIQQGKPHARDNNGKPQPWELYTGNMLRWRAVANACRLRFPDVLLGLSYLPEELGAYVDEEGRPVDAPEGQPAQQQRTAPPPPGLSQEQREANDWAPRIVERPFEPAFYGTLRETAATQGITEVKVDHPWEPGTAITIADLITAAEDRAAGIVEAEVVEPDQQPATAPPAAEEAPSAPTATEGAPQATQEAPVEAPPGVTAEDYAIAALEEGVVETLQVIYADAKAAGLLNADVGPHMSDEDRERLGTPPHLEVIPLGGLLIEAAKYVTKWGAGVRGDLTVAGWQEDPPVNPGDNPPPGYP